MLLPFLFILASQFPDTSTICSASCAMHISNGTNLRVSEHRLLKLSGEIQYAQWQPCKKTIEDTVSKESFFIDQSGWFGGNKVGKLYESHIGTNKVFLTHADKKGNIYFRIEPDSCTCQWTGTISSKTLPFVKKSLESISFVEN